MTSTETRSISSERGVSRNGGSILEDDPGRVKAFDFSRHEALDRSHLRLLRPILETVAGRTGSTIASAVRQLVHVDLDPELPQIAWEEFVGSLPDPTFVSTTVIFPVERRFVLHFPFALAIRIVDFMLGGDGSSVPEREDLTEIEHALLAPLVEMIWRDAIVGALSTSIEIANGNVYNSDSPILLQIGRPGELCLIVTMNIAVAEAEVHPVALCVPIAALAPVIEGLERLQSGTGPEPNMADTQSVERNLLGIPLDVKVSYAAFELTPRELLELVPGDVIHLGARPEVGSDLLRLVVDDVVYAGGILVEEGNKLALSITTTEEICS